MILPKSNFNKGYQFGKGSVKEWKNRRTFSEQLAVAKLRKLVLMCNDVYRDVISTVDAPDHNGAINLFNYSFSTSPIKDKGRYMEQTVSFSYGTSKYHDTYMRRSMNPKNHEKVDLMYLFNNGWRNSSIVFDTANRTKYTHSRTSTPVDFVGDYPGDGFMNEIASRLQSKFGSMATVTLSPEYSGPSFGPGSYKHRPK